jgi:ELWxxDGT repeat protein
MSNKNPGDLMPRRSLKALLDTAHSTPFFLFLLLALYATLAVAQTRLVKDISLDHAAHSSAPIALGTVGNITFFTGYDGKSSHRVLWGTDGTETGTIPLTGDNGPITFATDRPAIAVGNRLIFAASDSGHGQEYWTSDGTPGGTGILKDIRTGSEGSNPRNGAVVGSTLYFTATAPCCITSLWGSDGTPGGTRSVVDLADLFITPLFLGNAGPLLVFRGNTRDGGGDPSGNGVFASDGTAEGTHFLSPLYPLSGVTLGGTVLFTANDGLAGRWQLYKTDGTKAGTGLVRDGFASASPAPEFQVVGNAAYFVADDGINGAEVWRSDGTATGTGLLADLTPGAAGSTVLGLAALGSKLIITTGGAQGQLWVSDGTAAGTQLLKNVPNAGRGVSSGAFYYFAWDDGLHGKSLWKSDGTATGTTIVKETPAWVTSAAPVARPNGVFYTASDSRTGDEPWITDGTADGTRMLKNVAPDVELGSYPHVLRALNGRLFFVAWDDSTTAAWTSDGTTAGTRRIDPIIPLARRNYYFEGAATSGSLYYYCAGEPAKFWRTDGTPAGTFPITEIDACHLTVPFRGGMAFRGRLFPRDLWFTDGTEAGTRPVSMATQANGAFGFGSTAELRPATGFTSWRTSGSVRARGAPTERPTVRSR